MQGFGPGLVPLRNNDPRMMVLRKRFNTEVGIAYPVLITAGNLKNGTRAGTLNIGIRDLVRKMRKMPMNALGQLIHTGALPFIICISDCPFTPLSMLQCAVRRVFAVSFAMRYMAEFE